MPQLTNYYFDLFHRDVEPIVPGSNRWGVQGEYVIDSEHFGYTNWVSDEVVQSVVPNGEDVVLHIVSADVLLTGVPLTASTSIPIVGMAKRRAGSPKREY